MMGEQEIMHNAGEADATLRLLHGDLSLLKRQYCASDVFWSFYNPPPVAVALYLFTHFTGRVWCQADGGHSRPPACLTNEAMKTGQGTHNERSRANPHFFTST